MESIEGEVEEDKLAFQTPARLYATTRRASPRPELGFHPHNVALVAIAFVGFADPPPYLNVRDGTCVPQSVLIVI